MNPHSDSIGWVNITIPCLCALLSASSRPVFLIYYTGAGAVACQSAVCGTHSVAILWNGKLVVGACRCQAHCALCVLAQLLCDSLSVAKKKGSNACSFLVNTAVGRSFCCVVRCWCTMIHWCRWNSSASGSIPTSSDDLLAPALLVHQCTQIRSVLL